MITDPSLAFGIMAAVGIIGGLLANKAKFPRITGYIIVGVILSPSMLHLVSREAVDSWDIVTTIILAVIGYSIGGSLRLESIRKLGSSVLWITVAETVGALLAVTLMVAFIGSAVLNLADSSFLHGYLPVALVIGAAVCPAAPAVTLAVIRELRAKGPLTTNLLAVVALDDALGVIIFAIVLGVAQPLVNGGGGVAVSEMLGVPFLEIVKSLGVGAGLGFALIGMSKIIKSRKLLLALVIGMLMLCVGLVSILGISVILGSMVIGFVVRNRMPKMLEDEPFAVVEGIEDFIFAIFFVLSGMHFDLAVIKTAGILAAIIFAGRFLGKYLGVRVSAQLTRAPETVKKYLSFALMPEAGVTIGLALLAKEAFPSMGSVLLSGILASVIINELVAPPLTKYAIVKAGEADGTAPVATAGH